MQNLNNPVELALKLISCPSITPNEAGCFDLIEEWLKPIGFKINRIIFTGDGGEPTENLYAKRGNAQPNICFAGHIDVVEAGDKLAWNIPPFSPKIQDNILYGRGAEDMKGAIASFISAIPSINNDYSISLLLTADEEGNAINGTPKMLEWLKNREEVPDICLVGEPTNIQNIGDMCKIGRRGSLSCNLQIIGRQGHVAYPHLADNPNKHLIAMLHNLNEAILDEGSKFFPASNLEITAINCPNKTGNLIPATANADFNIRFNDNFTGESLSKWIKNKCQEIANNLISEYKLNIHISGESFINPPSIVSDSLIEAVQRITGLTPNLSTSGGTSDARFITNYCPVIEFGTTGFTPHKINECVRTNDLLKLRDIYREFLKIYSKK